MKKILWVISIVLLTFSCVTSPKHYSQMSALPPIFPDYTNITIPCNIAPLNFYVDSADAVIIKIMGGETREYNYRFNSSFVKFNPKQWKSMLYAEKGNTLEIFIRAVKGKEEKGYRGFTWKVAPEPVDKYLSYRLIEPAYEVWNMIEICERDVENYNVNVIGDNNLADHSCINCHSSNRSEGGQTTFMHIRGKNGGTIYVKDGIIRKLNTKTNQTAGSAVYGELDQSGRFGVFTTAEIFPILHSEPLGRLEVYDTSSDLILIDFQENTVTDSPIVKGAEFQETFPCFSAGDSVIYFCRAKRYSQPDSTKMMHYSLYSVRFDKANGRFANTIEKVIDAEALGCSISFPKCSPDGKYILLTVSDYGTFPIWHPETDLWMYDIASGQIDKMEKANGPFSDSYHCWSSNSKWIVWASKREDRVYGRPYYSYVNENGQVSKPFVLPQKDPKMYNTTLKSFNIPQMYNEPEVYNAVNIGKIYFKDTTESMSYK